MTYVQKSGVKDEVLKVELFAFTVIYQHCQVTDFLKNLFAFPNAEQQKENMYSLLVFCELYSAPGFSY